LSTPAAQRPVASQGERRGHRASYQRHLKQGLRQTLRVFIGRGEPALMN